MSPLDASFLLLEDASTLLHMGSVAIFEGPAPSHEEFRRLVGEMLPLSRRHRQKVRTVPLDFARPVWVDDPHFNLDYHVRRTALPAPGDAEQLALLVGRLMSQQLDRSKPLWELWVVEGLADGTWAQINKLHHSMVDGLAALDMTTLILDRSPERGDPPPDRWEPQSEPSRSRLIADAVTSRLTSSAEPLRWASAALANPRQAATQIGATARGAASLAGLGRPGTATTLTGPTGPHRRWNWSRAALEDVKAVRRAFGGTVNDVVLALVTRGFRDLLLSRGEAVEGVRLRAQVPVSIRRPGDAGYSNRVGTMFAELPVGIADPVERLHAISGQVARLKESAQAVAGDNLFTLSGLVPPMLVAPALRIATKLPQHSIATVITNLPGPPAPLYALGRRMLHIYPYVPLGGHVRIGVAVISYLGELHFGFSGDYDTTADLGVLRDGVTAAVAELLAKVE
ncbi:MAG: wax ester/triacylglycerol synthase family O-acyltransferase [Frankiaceae bacterium]